MMEIVDVVISKMFEPFSVINYTITGKDCHVVFNHNGVVREKIFDKTILESEVSRVRNFGKSLDNFFNEVKSPAITVILNGLSLDEYKMYEHVSKEIDLVFVYYGLFEYYNSYSEYMQDFPVYDICYDTDSKTIKDFIIKYIERNPSAIICSKYDIDYINKENKIILFNDLATHTTLKDSANIFATTNPRAYNNKSIFYFGDPIRTPDKKKQIKLIVDSTSDCHNIEFINDICEMIGLELSLIVNEKHIYDNIIDKFSESIVQTYNSVEETETQYETLEKAVIISSKLVDCEINKYENVMLLNTATQDSNNYISKDNMFDWLSCIYEFFDGVFSTTVDLRERYSANFNKLKQAILGVDKL